MATLEDTFRMMNGEKPVNTTRLTDADKNLNERKASPQLGGKITRDFMDCVKGTLIENRGGTRSQPNNIRETHSDLVDNAKILTALLNSIRDDRLDERVLMNVSRDLKNLTEHLSVYPEFNNIIKNKIK